MIEGFARLPQQGLIPNRFPDPERRPSTIPRTPLCGCFKRCARGWRREAIGTFLRDLFYPAAKEIVDWHLPRDIVRNRRRPAGPSAARRRSGNATYVDGREGRRPSGDAASRQAGGDQCAVAWCAASDGGIGAIPERRDWKPSRARELSRAFWNRAASASTTCVSGRRRRCQAPAQPDFCRESGQRAPRARSAAGRGAHRRARVVNTGGSAHAGPQGSRV